MAESWVRLWAGSTTDPKWQTIARKSGQPRYLVIALFTHLLMVANESEPRGSIAGLSIEDTASALDCDESQVSDILVAMNERVIDGVMLSGWDRRQPVREDSGDEKTGAKSSTERSREFRERQKTQRDETQCNAPQRDETQCNAPEAEADTEADIKPKPKAAALTQPESGEQSPPAAASGDPILFRACELSALLNKRGAALQASDPTVRGWAERGVTDAQILQTLEIAIERRSQKGDSRPVNAGFLNSILPDIVSPPQARASPPGRRKTLTETRIDTIAGLTGRSKNERTITAERDITADCQRIA